MSSVNSFTTSAAATGSGQVPLHGGGTDASLVQEMKHEIRSLVQEITQLAQADITEEEFYAGALNRIVSAMAAVGGAIWTLDQNTFSLQYQVNLAQVGLGSSEGARVQHQRLLERVAESQQALLVPPRSGPPGESEAANPSDQLLVIAPLLSEGRVQGIVEIFQRPGGGPTTQRGYLRFLAQMADIAADFLKNRRLRQLHDKQQVWQQLEQFLQSIHGSLDLRATSYAVVNEARRLLGCDRVSLALCTGGGRARIEAVSGLDSIERRANQIRRLQDLSRAVLKTRQPFWHEAGGEDAPPQIEAPLQQYVDVSHARMLGIVPLFAPATRREATSTEPENGVAKSGPLLGALVIEQLREDRASASLRSRTETVALHTSTAIANADRYSSLFLLPVWQTLGRATRFFRGWALARTILLVGLLAAGGAALLLVQQDFEIAARGRLQPAERREVFAGIEGIVAQVPVRHGQQVQAGEVLVEMQNNDLEQQLASLIGRQNTNQEQVAALQRALLDTSAANSRLEPGEENRMAGQMLELRQEAENLQRELELFRAKQRRLTVVAEQPGQVITWKVDELLLRRPVDRGQVLMTVANPHGPWELELYVPERRMKHLANALNLPAQEGQRPPLEVTFMLSSHPGEEFHGSVVEIEQTTEVRGEDGNTVLVRVAIDKNALPPLHDQVSVTGKLYCGRTSIGHAWFCDLIEAAQTKILFWL
jgi:hypothetical protein